MKRVVTLFSHNMSGVYKSLLGQAKKTTQLKQVNDAYRRLASLQEQLPHYRQNILSISGLLAQKMASYKELTLNKKTVAEDGAGVAQKTKQLLVDIRFLKAALTKHQLAVNTIEAKLNMFAQTLNAQEKKISGE